MTVTNPSADAGAAPGEPAVLRPNTNRYLAGNFAPVTEEVTVTDLTVTGTLPPELNGRYLRIGPNPLSPQDPSAYHWFTGDGMAHGVRLRDGDADWYRNRWIRSTPVSETLDEPPAPGERHGGFDGANTNIVTIGGRTHAIVEAGGRPVELTDELETVRHSDFGGTLPHGFTAIRSSTPPPASDARNTIWGGRTHRVRGGRRGRRVRRTVDCPPAADGARHVAHRALRGLRPAGDFDSTPPWPARGAVLVERRLRRPIGVLPVAGADAVRWSRWPVLRLPPAQQL